MSPRFDELLLRTELLLERMLLPAPAYRAAGWDELAGAIAAALGGSLLEAMREPELAEIEATVRAAAAAVPLDASLPRVHDASFTLARLCYAVVRATRPGVVVETGVGFGVTSSFLLRALARNGTGALHSIDRPSQGRGAERWVGSLVPQELRGPWSLHRAASLDALPLLLPRLGPVDLFLHDSRHTYRNMMGELTLVESRLAPRAVVLADDIERNVAFERWLAARSARFGGVLREEGKPGLLGICAL